MSSLHQQAKEAFLDLYQLSRAEQEAEIQRRFQHAPELADEVRSLLDHHLPSPTAIESKPLPNSKLPSLWQRTVARFPETPFLTSFVFLTLVFVIILYALEYYALNYVAQNITLQREGQLRQVAANQYERTRLWHQAKIASLQPWLQDRTLLDAASELANVATDIENNSPTNGSTSLLQPLRLHKASVQLRDQVLRLSQSSSLASSNPNPSDASSPAFTNTRPEVKYLLVSSQGIILATNQQSLSLGSSLESSLDASNATFIGSQVNSQLVSELTELRKTAVQIAIPRLLSTMLPSSAINIDHSTIVVAFTLPNSAPNSAPSPLAPPMLLIYDTPLDQEFAGIFRDTRAFDATGKCYAIDRAALSISPLRFQITPNNDKSILIHDPGGDLTQGFQPADASPNAWPKTRIARLCLEQKTESLQDDYRDYRGVPVIGACRWLDELQMGIIVEMDAAEVAAPIKKLVQTIVWGRSILLTSSVLALLVWLAKRLRKQRLRVHSRIGPYQLDELIGEGGIGQVYRATHALLRRPTAIKLLKGSSHSASSLSRFEREVQLASQLVHPNSIAIYDYGRTHDGTLYYAMEFVPGLNLTQMVRAAGPIPANRVLYLLIQLCSALREAHRLGIVHRDIKPQNIMVCAQGCQWDVVKVLDYGLVKQQGNDQRLSTEVTQTLIGTPIFMAPERFHTPWLAQPSIDIYGVGAVGLFMLIGEAALAKETPSGVPKPLTDLLRSCVSIQPEQRPDSIETLLEKMQSLQQQFPWTETDARQWWERFDQAGT